MKGANKLTAKAERLSRLAGGRSPEAVRRAAIAYGRKGLRLSPRLASSVQPPGSMNLLIAKSAAECLGGWTPRAWGVRDELCVPTWRLKPGLRRSSPSPHRD